MKPKSWEKELVKCDKCQKKKPIIEFWKNKARVNGLDNYCKNCAKQYRANRLRNPITKLRVRDSEKRSRRKAGVIRLAKEREYYHKNRLNKLEYFCNYYQNNKEHFLAVNKLNEAVNQGKIRKKECSICGESKTEAHHFNYLKPLEVIWLCRSHHQDLHEEIRQIISQELEKFAKEIVKNNTDDWGQVDYKGIAEEVIKALEKRSKRLVDILVSKLVSNANFNKYVKRTNKKILKNPESYEDMAEKYK